MDYNNRDHSDGSYYNQPNPEPPQNNREEKDLEYPVPPYNPAENGMAAAALILSIIGIVTSCCFYLSIPAASLGILLAILSKGKEPRFSTNGRLGLKLSIGALILSAVLLIIIIAANYVYIDTEQFKEYMRYYNSSSMESQKVQEMPEGSQYYRATPKSESTNGGTI